MALAAEDAGFDSIWVGDHYLYRGDGRPERGPWEAWTMLAALATVTRRVRLGPLVACLNFHPPAVLAKIAATVDEVSGGRLILGMGAGWNRTEFDAFGIPYDHRASRFEESFEIVRRLLDGERVTFAGRWHSTSDAILLPKPVGRPTLMVGSTGPRVLAATLPHVDVWNTWYDLFANTPEGFARERPNDRRRLRARGSRPGDPRAERVRARSVPRRCGRTAGRAGRRARRSVGAQGRARLVRRSRRRRGDPRV